MWNRGTKTRRWSRPFRRFPKKIPARKIPRSIARVRTDWVQVYNFSDQPSQPGGTGCAWATAPWAPVTLDVEGVPTQQCFSSVSFRVMTAAELSELYGDDVKIVKMIGAFTMRPVFQTEDACLPDDLAVLQAAWQDYFIRVRGGLFKTRRVSSNPDTDPVIAHPLFGRDWTDAGFLKTFERNWISAPPESTATTFGEGQLINAIGAVTRTAYTDSGWTLASGSGTKTPVNVPEIRTDCFNCTVPAESCYDGPSYTRYTGPNWKRVSISSGKTIRMHEDDALTWVLDWTRFEPGAPLCGTQPGYQVPCAIQMVVDLKLKLQYG